MEIKHDHLCCRKVEEALGYFKLLGMRYGDTNAVTQRFSICLWNGSLFPAGNYIFRVNNRNTRRRCGICPKITMKTPERRNWRRSGFFIVIFGHISHLVLGFLLLTLIRWMQTLILQLYLIWANAQILENVIVFGIR